MQILGISGSLRSGSYNTAVLEALKGLMPEGTSMSIRTGGGLPLYNADEDGENKPEPVMALLEQIRASEALIFATPEFNYGIPGSLKNLIDWASRPAFNSVLTRKPAGILSASRSPVGGARAQASLRQVLAGTLCPVFPYVDMLVGSAHLKFDEHNILEDDKTRERLNKYAAAFVEWVKRQR